MIKTPQARDSLGRFVNATTEQTELALAQHGSLSMTTRVPVLFVTHGRDGFPSGTRIIWRGRKING